MHGYREQQTWEQGHGWLEASSTLNDWLGWPELGQVLMRMTWRELPAIREVQESATYAVTSLTSEEASVEDCERLWHCR